MKPSPPSLLGLSLDKIYDSLSEEVKKNLAIRLLYDQKEVLFDHLIDDEVLIRKVVESKTTEVGKAMYFATTPMIRKLSELMVELEAESTAENGLSLDGPSWVLNSPLGQLSIVVNLVGVHFEIIEMADLLAPTLEMYYDWSNMELVLELLKKEDYETLMGIES